MKKFRDMSEGTQGLVVSVSMGVIALAVGLAVKLLYQML
jgi:hypothetical protein